MANLVQLTDFIGEINIVLNTPTCGEAQKLENIIEDYETDIIVSLLGGMTADFYAGLTANTVKYKELLDGKEYQLNGMTLKFIGLRKLVAFKIYEIYQQNSVSASSNNGEVKTANVGMEVISPNAKLVNANNQYAKRVGKQCRCSSNCNCKYLNTLHNFLSVGDYENWSICDSQSKYKNRLGL